MQQSEDSDRHMQSTVVSVRGPGLGRRPWVLTLLMAAACARSQSTPDAGTPDDAAVGMDSGTTTAPEDTMDGGALEAAVPPTWPTWDASTAHRCSEHDLVQNTCEDGGFRYYTVNDHDGTCELSGSGDCTDAGSAFRTLGECENRQGDGGFPRLTQQTVPGMEEPVCPDMAPAGVGRLQGATFFGPLNLNHAWLIQIGGFINYLDIYFARERPLRRDMRPLARLRIWDSSSSGCYAGDHDATLRVSLAGRTFELPVRVTISSYSGSGEPAVAGSFEIDHGGTQLEAQFELARRCDSYFGP